MSELPKEVIAAWKLENQWFAKVKRCEIPCDDTAMAFATIADALRDTLARALKAEFINDSNFHHCIVSMCTVPQHKWTDADWQTLAEKELRGEK